MSKRVLHALSLILLAAAVTGGPAQAQMIGYVDQRAVLASMPGMQEVQRKMKKAMKKQRQQLQKKRQKFQKRVKQFRQQQSLLDDSARAQRKRALQKRQRQIQRSTRERQRQMQQKRRKLMQPLLKKLQGAIDKVAAQKELEAVMRKQVLLYDDQTSGGVVNITRDVANELGVSLTQSPGEPAPTLDQTPQPGGGGGQ